ncbi:MAG: HAD-IA family hydrolase [Rhodomicrobiaceae bacterium]
MLQAIIFDVDGTLAETEEVHCAAFNQAFAEAGLGWRWNEDLYRELLKVTGGKERIASFIESAGGLGMRPAGVETLIADLHRRKTAIYAELLAGGSVKPRPGVAGLIEGALIDGIRLAIATTTSRPNVDALLIAILDAGSPSAFEVIAAGDSVAAKKPAPDIFIAALGELGLHPRDCLAIEDSQNGLRAATAAGLATLVTPSHYARGDDFTGAARVVDVLPALVGPPKTRNANRPFPSSDLVDAVRMLHHRAVTNAASVPSLAAAVE